MAQNNYFTYNIIDSIYFNQPTGNELTDIYGIENSFNRRNPIQYNEWSAEDKLKYDEQEQRFIQAVINKYMIDDLYNGSYIGIDDEYHDQYNKDLSYAYFSPNHKVGIELPDMISNINGTHYYKLLSAKDIDFDNVILPNSAISREYNWGGFDRNRRWGDKPIRINNTFELLNVIDYLLCACDNLWNELSKLKYSVNNTTDIWFTKNALDEILIKSSKRLVSQDFQLNSNDRTDETRMITYLNPFNYYTSLNNNSNNNFGVVTNFYKSKEDIQDLSFDRKIIDVGNRNIILMDIFPLSKIINNNYQSSTTQNVDGTLQYIYAYKIGDELKIYPGAQIDTYVNENNIIINPNELIDFKNKKLKKETFFKPNSSINSYFKVYIEFLNQDLLFFTQNNIRNPYFVYYINNNNEKMIISYNYEGSNNYIGEQINNIISNIISGNQYKSYKDYNNNTNVGPDNVNNSNYEPKFFVIPDEFSSILEVSTPNSSIFMSSSQSIKIYYYKNSNKLDCTITRKDRNNEIIDVLPEKDPMQNESLSYNYHRYIIPDGQEITFKFDATYIASDNSPEGNPLGLKLDDEYKDIMLYNPSNISALEKTSYYQLIDIDYTETYKRNFEQFTPETFDSNKNRYTMIDNNTTEYKHVWTKYDNPYKLNVMVDNDELIVQSLTYEQVQDEIENINLISTSYNSYTLIHNLSNNTEEVKFNLRFQIDETSKVKATECLIPLSICKIYNPTINYYSRGIVEKENSYYADITYQYTYNGDEHVNLSQIYTNSFSKYTNENIVGLDNIPNICSYLIGHDIEYLEDLQLQSSYDNIFNNSIFEITYNSKFNIVNLIGSWYTEKYIASKFPNKKGIAPISIKKLTDNSTITIKSLDVSENQYYSHPYIFNINGFSKNYRLHGNSHSLPDDYKVSMLNTSQTLKLIQEQFDLISVASPVNYQSINENLQIKIVDDNVQLSNIAVSNNSNVYEWNPNDEDFHSGANISNNDFIIKTYPVDIYKTSYTVKCTQDFDNNSAPKITYYIPITYMYINSSTFYPPNDTKPNNNIHDINNQDDKERYIKYIKCWDNYDSSYYHPITLSLKLFDNTSKSNPYYYESNEAKMQFNIKRTGFNSQINVSGLENRIYISTNAKYYLSDFIKMGNIAGRVNEINFGNELPTGSYFYYDDKYNSYMINEIYTNVNIQDYNEHNAHYKNVNTNYYSNNVNTMKYNSFSPISESGNEKVPYPIFYQQEETNDNIEFNTQLYDYDIYRLSDINKLRIREGAGISAQLGKYMNNESNTGSIETNPDVTIQGIDTNQDLYTIEFNNTNFLSNFEGNFTEENDFYFIYYTISHSGVRGSKNYTAVSSTTGSTNTIICPIVRKKFNTTIDGQTIYANLYSTINRNNETYEFFEFKYDNVYRVLKDNNTNEYHKYPIKPGAQFTGEIANVQYNQVLTCQQSYDIQLYLFLHSNSDEDDFICNNNPLFVD